MASSSSPNEAAWESISSCFVFLGPFSRHQSADNFFRNLALACLNPPWFEHKLLHNRTKSYLFSLNNRPKPAYNGIPNSNLCPEQITIINNLKSILSAPPLRGDHRKIRSDTCLKSRSKHPQYQARFLENDGKMGSVLLS